MDGSGILWSDDSPNHGNRRVIFIMDYAGVTELASQRLALGFSLEMPTRGVHTCKLSFGYTDS